MSEATPIILAFAAGGALGALFFAGLWWTVQRLGRSRRPGLLLVVGFLLRMAVALGGFYLAARFGWKPLLACLAGFMLARSLVACGTRPRPAAAAPPPPAP